MLSILGERERPYSTGDIIMSYRLCISDVVHCKMARDEAQHGTFSEPTRTGIHTTTQRGTVSSCIDMVHRRKRTAWLLVEAKRSRS